MPSLPSQSDQLVGQSRSIGNRVEQPGTGGHATVSVVRYGPVGWLECSCGRVTEVYEGGASDCRFARLEEEYATRLAALHAEFAGRLQRAQASAENDEREWRRVQRRRARATA